MCFSNLRRENSLLKKKLAEQKVLFKEEKERNAENKAQALMVEMYQNTNDSQQSEIEDQAMEIRKQKTQISLINQKLIEKAAESKIAMEKKNSEINSLKNKLNGQQSEIIWTKEIFLASLKVSKKFDEISQNGGNLKLTGHKFPELATAGHKKTKAVADWLTKYAFETERGTETRPGFETGYSQSDDSKKHLSLSKDSYTYKYGRNTPGPIKIKAAADFSGTKHALETKKGTETRPGFETGLTPSEHAKNHHFGELCIFWDSANTDSIRQAKGEPGEAPVPTPTFETNKAKKRLSESDPDKLATFKDVNSLWGKILAQNGVEMTKLGNLCSKSK